ncbi:hypothetical protein SAMN06265795_110115 [Noviherbaspirillum humi]|uniref:Urease accessory protein UreH-like transmembrane domain-containing protein n=1 Tax=Noviherbaspirillum humi TaxID=1688639 RepID=A0A239IU01_9BURK|nr:sulfite exporter TauE/SafE family protein [Noviherbaspirillum humi]SNS96862.1 hypothetical protein SAMN06265795_110115 [Noviherbaspirillum humi]
MFLATSPIALLPFFLIGLLGSVHCVGMCGGIVGALSAAGGKRRIPIAVAGGSAALSQAAAFDDALRVVSYNAGRLASYATAGAIAGGFSAGARALGLLSVVQTAGYWLASLMLVALGLTLMNVWQGLSHIERLGRVLWRRIQPLTRHFLPMDTPLRAFALGGLWGWLPCGMVYSMLTTAMLSGSAASGAAIMLAFGAGTLPMLFSLGMFGARLQAWTRSPRVRLAAGLLVLGFGLLGLARAATGGLPLGWLEALCLTPGAH